MSRGRGPQRLRARITICSFYEKRRVQLIEWIQNPVNRVEKLHAKITETDAFWRGVDGELIEANFMDGVMLLVTNATFETRQEAEKSFRTYIDKHFFRFCFCLCGRDELCACVYREECIQIWKKKKNKNLAKAFFVLWMNGVRWAQTDVAVNIVLGSNTWSHGDDNHDKCKPKRHRRQWRRRRRRSGRQQNAMWIPTCTRCVCHSSSVQQHRIVPHN